MPDIHRPKHSRGAQRWDMVAAVAVALFCGLTAFGFWKSNRATQKSPKDLHPLVVKGKPIDSPVTPPVKKDGPGPQPGGEPNVPANTGGDATNPDGATAPPGGHDPNKHPGGGDPLAPRKEADIAEYPDMTFEVLASYTYVPPPKVNPKNPPVERKKQIPDDITELGGKKFCVTGYMLPTEMEEDRVTAFLLLRTPMQCCFGVAPQVNEWVVIRMSPDAPAVEPEYKPVSVSGVLEVGEEIKDGWVTSVYRMSAVKVETR